MLDPRLKESLQSLYQSLLQEGELLAVEKLDACYALFQKRFGSDVLAKLHGEELLKLRIMLSLTMTTMYHYDHLAIAPTKGRKHIIASRLCQRGEF